MRRGVCPVPVSGLAVYLAAALLAATPASGAVDGRRRTDVVRAVEAVAPAVVNISASEIYGRRSPFSLFDDPLFEDFFGRYFESRPAPRERRVNLGSGMILRRDGYVLTNQHVIARASRTWVTTSDGGEFEARVVGADTQADLAVLKIDAGRDLPEAPLGDSDDLMIGEPVIAIGNPFGLSNSVTTGVVSALKRSIKLGGDAAYDDFIQTDASINPGNSGGPLINILGQVVGINTAVYKGGEGIGFAIPIKAARKISAELMRHGRVQRGWFGLFVQDLSEGLRESFAHKSGGGILVTGVMGGPKSGGLARGDIIVSLDGRAVADVARFTEIAASYLPGDEVKVVFQREGERKTAGIACRGLSLEEASKLAWDILGLEMDKKPGTKTGGLAVVKVRQGSHGQRLGLERGDVLREINQVPLVDGEAFIKAMTGIIYRSMIPIVLQRDEYVYHLTLIPGK